MFALRKEKKKKEMISYSDATTTSHDSQEPLIKSLSLPRPVLNRLLQNMQPDHNHNLTIRFPLVIPCRTMQLIGSDRPFHRLEAEVEVKMSELYGLGVGESGHGAKLCWDRVSCH
jgi:hypothetical protein